MSLIRRSLFVLQRSPIFTKTQTRPFISSNQNFLLSNNETTTIENNNDLVKNKENQNQVQNPFKIMFVTRDVDQMRLDRFLRNNNAQISQGLLEKSLRKGKVKKNLKFFLFFYFFIHLFLKMQIRLLRREQTNQTTNSTSQPETEGETITITKISATSTTNPTTPTINKQTLIPEGFQIVKDVFGGTRLSVGDRLQVPKEFLNQNNNNDPDSPFEEQLSSEKEIDEETKAMVRSWVIYKDDDILAIDKPAGLATQG